MLKELLERLRLSTQDEEGYDVKEYALKIQERQALRAEIEAHKSEREAELADIEHALSDLDYAEAVTDSFQGGPSDNETE